MNDERRRSFIAVLAHVDGALERQATEITNVRRDLAESLTRFNAATSATQQDLSMDTISSVLKGAMARRVEGMREAQGHVDFMLGEWKAGR